MTEALDARPPAALPRQPAGEPPTHEHALADSGSDRYLRFVLDGEIYALSILDVTEILQVRSLTTVPMMPSFIRGVINLRGRVVPVVDLAARFGIGHTEIARRTSIIIVDDSTTHGDQAGHSLGIMVDAVNKVVHLGGHDIESPPTFGAGISTDYISGMAKYDNGFMIVLDASRVLSVNERAELGSSSPPLVTDAPGR